MRIGKDTTAKRRRDRLRAEGRCINCGIGADGASRCQPCQARVNGHIKKYRQRKVAEWKAAGKCVRHGAPKPCGRCRAFNAATNRRRRERLLTALEARDGAGCFYCDTLFAEHMDHIVPRRVGTNGSRRRGLPSPRELPNLRLACSPCNHKKRDLPVSEFVARLSADGIASRRALAAHGQEWGA